MWIDRPSDRIESVAKLVAEDVAAGFAGNWTCEIVYSRIDATKTGAGLWFLDPTEANLMLDLRWEAK